MAWKLQMLGAAVAVCVLAGSSTAQSTNTVLNAGITGQTDVRNLLLTQDDSTTEEARWGGGYRGWGGGYRGWGGGYRGWGGGYRGWGGGYRGWYGGYRSFYRPYYYGARFAYGYGYGYYSPYYYYPQVYYYSPYYYYPGTVYVAPTTLTDSGNPAAAPPEVPPVPPQENQVQPRLAPSAASNPYDIPRDGTYRYNGGPSNPVPPAKVQPDTKPAPGTVPLEGRPVSLPAKPTPFAYPAYGDSPARTNFAVDRVVMNKTAGK